MIKRHSGRVTHRDAQTEISMASSFENMARHVVLYVYLVVIFFFFGTRKTHDLKLWPAGLTLIHVSEYYVDVCEYYMDV